jgi:hypothetical protein
MSVLFLDQLSGIAESRPGSRFSVMKSISRVTRWSGSWTARTFALRKLQEVIRSGLK